LLSSSNATLQNLQNLATFRTEDDHVVYVLQRALDFFFLALLRNLETKPK